MIFVHAIFLSFFCRSLTRPHAPRGDALHEALPRFRKREPPSWCSKPESWNKLKTVLAGYDFAKLNSELFHFGWGVVSPFLGTMESERSTEGACAIAYILVSMLLAPKVTDMG